MNCAVGCGLVRVGAAYPKHSMRVVDYAVHFPTQTRPSYYYEKRFRILYISQYYIYRINFHQRGCNLDVCSMISTKPRAPIDPCARSGLHAGHRVATTSASTGQPNRVDEDPKRGCRVRLRARVSDLRTISGAMKRASSSSSRRCARRRQTCCESGLDQRAGPAPWLSYIICRHRFIIFIM